MRRADDLLDEVWGDTMVGMETVRSTASAVRSALRRAVSDAGLTIADPFPSVGRGRDLAYRLALDEGN